MGINNNKIILDEIILRRQAEEHLKAKTSDVESIRKNEETLRLLHELEIHQVELEMQNAELRQSRDEAERSLEKYTDLYEFAPVGYFTLNRNGTINDVNLRGASLVDVARPRLLGQSFVFFVSDEFRLYFNDFLDKVFLNQDKTVCEVALQKNGNIALYVQLEAMTTISGQECHLALIDITERKRVEELLLHSEKRYRTVVEDHTEIICRFKTDGTFTFVNDVYSRIFDKSKDELLGTRWAPNVFSDDVANIEEQLRTMSPENPLVVIENRVNAASGEILWMQFVNRGFFNSKGQLLETQSVGRDITERKVVENALRTSDESLSLALSASKMGVWEWNVQSNAITWSPKCLKIFGVEGLGVTLESFTNVIHPDDVVHLIDAIYKSIAEKTDCSVEFRIIKPGGYVCWFLGHARPTYDENGSPLLLIGTVQEITERKLAAEEMRSYASRLIVMEEELRVKLAAELHDEICRDLTVLGMNMAIISDAMTDVAPKKLISRIKDSGRLIKGISHTVRNIMVGLRPPTLDDFGLLAALRWHADLFSKRTGVEVSIQADEPFPRFMIEKETALFRISQEALMNASKYAATQYVTIKLRITNGMIIFDVVDKGKGILAAKSSLNQTGSGWGMTIMRERAELNGGNFYVDSTPGKGTTVSVVMPLEVI